ncbi:MAG: hypothetical protein JO050_06310 [Acidimicrobiia bacterium]|nr:hypothetical protein [Acidimicrobiia bacterium]
MTGPEQAATAAGIDAADVELAVAETLLHSDDALAVDDARHVLTSVEADLGRLASAPDTDTDTARQLLTVRADLSGHLLAAGALETAGAPADGVARMLRRAAGTARAGLSGGFWRAPVGAGRR